jgi:2-polyprenyl-6-methoxyphenol hydroxylase-like FAD-dependent oxidoreductase
MADAVVAGGGPAGSACALALARAGLAVTLIERAAFPRRKVCGEYLNAGAVAALDRLGVLPAVRALAHPLRGVRLMPAHASTVELPFDHPALACERAVLDAALLDAAIAAGVTVVRGRVTGVLRAGERIAGLTMSDAGGALHEVRARWTIGADGCGSVVARDAGLVRHSWKRPRFAIGGHYTGFGAFDGFIEMYVGGGAYFALNPLGGDRTNVMVVVAKRQLEAWSRFVDRGIAGKAAELAQGRRSFAGAQLDGARAAIGPLAHDVRAPIAAGLVLVGDAAGFLNPFTGQGVFLALTSAASAAEAIVAGARNRAAEPAAFARFADARASDFAARSRVSGLVSTLVDLPPLARRAAARLTRSPQLAATLVDALAGIRAPQHVLAPAVLRKLVL